MNNFQTCVACYSAHWQVIEEHRGFQLAQCHECRLTFTLNPDYQPERYHAAYVGEGDIPVVSEHSYVYESPAERLRLETRAYILPPPRLIPAERLALCWLKEKASRVSTVVDCGCGTGRFLRALKRNGLRAIGVDISSEVINLLNQTGLRAIQGKAPDFPWEENHPFAITFFEVLEHIPAPVEVLTALRERFPETVILASVPSPNRPGLLLKGERNLPDYPPNHFLRWTPKALEAAFQKAGYSKVHVVLPKPVGSEILPGLGQIVFKIRKQLLVPTSTPRVARGQSERTPSRQLPGTAARLKATGVLWFLWLYQRVADIVGYPMAWNAARKGASAGSMLVIAEP
jgi:SAM-dependent methyltransferase